MAFGLKELLKKFTGKTVMITTRCGTIKELNGQIKDVFDDFFILLTLDVGTDRYSVRNFIPYDNLAVLTQLTEVGTEAMEVTR